MTGTITLPIWLFGLILLFAAVTALSHFLLPPVRWFLRRRMERVVAELNKRLDRPIQPFKLARRTDMIQRLIYDPSVVRAVAEHAAENGLREDVAFHKARRYAREIVPSFSATAYFGIAIRLARWLSVKLFRVRLGHYDAQALTRIDAQATVVFVMNHRSNMDYVLVTYLAAERSALSYAVGEWANVWPMRQLIRAMGAYFIRRKSRNALYRKVLARYVQLATEAGVTQAVFPEGGLSLTGALAAPKLGLLNYIVSEFDPQGRDVVFVPVALNYDRVIEDRILTEAGRMGHRRFRGSILSAAHFTLRYVWRRVTGRAHRFGYAAVSFGAPLSLKSVFGTATEDPTRLVGQVLMSRIADVMPVLPVPLVAALLQRHGSRISEVDLRSALDAAAEGLVQRGATLHLARDDAAYTLDFALRHLALRRIILREAGQVEIKDPELIAFYAASIAHLMDAPAAEVLAKEPEAAT